MRAMPKACRRAGSDQELRLHLGATHGLEWSTVDGADHEGLEELHRGEHDRVERIGEVRHVHVD